GLGEPVFGKLDALLAHAILSIGAVKGIQFGDGFALSAMRGSHANDQRTKDGFLSNHSGGILGGISSGQEIVFQAAIKPTSSIGIGQRTVDKEGNDVTLTVTGRHDPCICGRAVVVIEAMTAITSSTSITRRSGKMHERYSPDRPKRPQPPSGCPPPGQRSVSERSDPFLRIGEISRAYAYLSNQRDQPVERLR
ncbi:MAG TPA: chorismate synthase, partial [Sphaerochaeta sp.]|nr:chorismate synthase [Sphaerochaeta sp.]